MALVTAVGLAAALLFIDWAMLLIVSAVIAGVVAPLHLGIAMVTEDFSYGLLRRVAGWVLRAVAFVLMICGYAVSIGLATLPLLGLVAASAWYIFVEPTTSQDPANLSDEELCAAWQFSCAVLETCRTPEDLQSVANLRSRYLDEFERRRPDAFTEWLNAGPQAASHAADYFIRGHHGGDPAA